MVELPIGDTDMVGVSQQVVHAINTKCVSNNNFREDSLTVSEFQILRLFW